MSIGSKYGRSVVILFVSLALLLAFGGAPSSAAKITMRCGTPDRLDGALSMTVKWAFEEIEKKAPGRFDFKIFPLQQLGNNFQMIEQVQLGTLDCLMSAAAFLSGAYPPISVLGLPFLFPDNDDALRAVLKKGKAVRFMLDDMGNVGFKGVAIHTSGFIQLTNSKRPITKLEDFKGIKFRAMASPVRLAQFKALGANAIPIPFPEVYNALQTGLADGQENPYWFIYQMKLHEVQKYLTVSNHNQNGLFWVLSKKFWKKVPADLQKLVEETFVEAEKIQWEVARRIDKTAIVALKKGGLKFVTISAKERERLRQATLNVKDVYFKRVGDKGRKIYSMLMEDIKRFSK